MINIAPGTRAYVMNFVSRNVSVVDLETDQVIQTIRLTSLPPAGSQDEQLLVGEEMFFSSRGLFDRPGGTTVSTSERLSSEGWQNCASCHFKGLTDGVVWQFGAGPRKSVPLNGTFSPHNPNDQRILNYSAIFDEVEDFELNIRNVSGPGNVPRGPPPVLDPKHGLIIGETHQCGPGCRESLGPTQCRAPAVHRDAAGQQQAWPALDALKEWVRFSIRTPNGVLTTDELTAGGGNPTGGLSPGMWRTGAVSSSRRDASRATAAPSGR